MLVQVAQKQLNGPKQRASFKAAMEDQEGHKPVYNQSQGMIRRNKTAIRKSKKELVSI